MKCQRLAIYKHDGLLFKNMPLYIQKTSTLQTTALFCRHVVPEHKIQVEMSPWKNRYFYTIFISHTDTKMLGPELIQPVINDDTENEESLTKNEMSIKEGFTRKT